ncbi:S-adenosyl-L-methionine-dependent methyltransferase [Dipodascopsis tothii]|uniref:S-adenosyl-L-methionine-dependent methyltransferase n=1 Tax=Dipodascopsis tothii TaxID=44089 RepID=UPI0034CE08BE
MASKNRVVQATDTDALLSKVSAVRAGYLDDELAELFVPSGTDAGRKLPLINRGTYVRATAISALVEAFLEPSTEPDADQRRQIVSLGAGSDTRPFKYLPAHAQLVYHEVDFAASTARKAATIAAQPRLAAALDAPEYDLAAPPAFRPSPPVRSVSSGRYYLHGADLRRLGTAAAVAALGLAPDVPTLVLSECCLCYLEPEATHALLRALAAAVGPVGVVSYEPFGGDDAFGAVMVQNLAARGISMPALTLYPDLHRQLERLRGLGFGAAAGANVRFIHDDWLDARERARIDGLELLDEREEFDLLAAHYGVAWATSGGFRGAFAGWKRFHAQDS